MNVGNSYPFYHWRFNDEVEWWMPIKDSNDKTPSSITEIIRFILQQRFAHIFFMLAHTSWMTFRIVFTWRYYHKRVTEVGLNIQWAGIYYKTLSWMTKMATPPFHFVLPSVPKVSFIVSLPVLYWLVIPHIGCIASFQMIICYYWQIWRWVIITSHLDSFINICWSYYGLIVP